MKSDLIFCFEKNLQNSLGWECCSRMISIHFFIFNARYFLPTSRLSVCFFEFFACVFIEHENSTNVRLFWQTTFLIKPACLLTKVIYTINSYGIKWEWKLHLIFLKNNGSVTSQIMCKISNAFVYRHKVSRTYIIYNTIVICEGSDYVTRDNVS